MLRIIFILFLWLLYAHSVNAQNDAKTSSEIDVYGNLNLSYNYYSARAELTRTSPWSYGLSGTIGLRIGKFNIPINLIYQDHGFSLTRPFFYLGTSIKLGKLSLELGNRNTRFSNYTLGGATFFGVAAEYNLKPLRLGLMSGTIQNPFVQKDSLLYGSIELPNFNRKAIAAKLGFGSEHNFIDLIALKVKDDVGSLDNEGILNAPLTPKDNLVVGTVIQTRLSNRIYLKADAAFSAVTYNSQYDAVIFENELTENYDNLLGVNLTTNGSYAGDIEMKMNFKRLKFSTQYRYIAPNFLSLGTNYLNPDRSEILFKLSGNMFQNKLRINSSIGIQQAGIQDTKTRKTRRLVNSVTAIYRPSKKFNIHLLYYNYDIEAKPTLVEDNDSLKLVRIMNQLRVSPKLNIKAGVVSHMFSLQGTYRVVSSSSFQTSNNTSSYSLSGAYHISHNDLGSNLRLGLNMNQNLSGGIRRSRYGSTLTFSQKLLEKKLNLSINASYFENLVEDKKDGQTTRFALASSIKLQEQHGFSMSMNYIRKSSIVFKSRNDFQFRTSYSFNF